MKERASLTNAVVSRLPAPMRNPRLDCSMKKPSSMSHASGGLATYCCPCGPHRRATVAGLGLVGGTVRSSQDASSHLEHADAVSMVSREPRSVQSRQIFALGCHGRAKASAREPLLKS